MEWNWLEIAWGATGGIWILTQVHSFKYKYKAKWNGIEKYKYKWNGIATGGIWILTQIRSSNKNEDKYEHNQMREVGHKAWRSYSDSSTATAVASGLGSF